MKVKTLLINWTNWSRPDMAMALKKFRLAGCLRKHPSIKHFYIGIAMFDKYEFDCSTL